MKPLVYVSGPIAGDPFGCVRAALPAFHWLRANDYTPIVPQFSVIAEMVEHVPYESWLAYDFDLIRHCHAMLRLPGVSPGANREEMCAAGLGLPIWDWEPESQQVRYRLVSA